MKKVSIRALAFAGAFFVSNFARAQFADAVISYQTGTGFAAGFTNASAALGAPASGPSVTPFAPPFSKTQIVSIGAGGEITLQMDRPIMNNPANPYGIDFDIFANEFFVQASGGKVGGVFNHAVSALVQVSTDDANWFTLNPSLAPKPGLIFPTDGAGNPLTPVNPGLTAANFNGQTLAGIRGLYNGSAGGTGYDLAWAEDANSNSVDLAQADFVRIEVQSGVLNLDAVAATAPTPVPDTTSTMGALALACAGLFGFARRGARSPLPASKFIASVLLLAGLFLAPASVSRAETIIENFTNNPAADGWQVYGDTNLFVWDSTNHNLKVDWDSTQSNSYFYHSLSNVLGEQDGFTLEFDLQLTNAIAGGDFGFELAVGFLNFAGATNATFDRGAAVCPNLVEFDYFPPLTNVVVNMTNNFPPSIDATMVDLNDTFQFFFDEPLLSNNVTYHFAMNHNIGDRAVTSVISTYLTNGMLQTYTTLPSNFLSTNFVDFFVDTISISSYNGANADGSISAQGTIANLKITTKPRPVGNSVGALTNSIFPVQFSSRTNFNYTLQRSSDLKNWTSASATTPGNGTRQTLHDTNAPGNKVFYRVEASQ